MASVWITYAWDDNKNQDVDFIAQELTNVGLTVKLDRWNIRAGERLWSQIEKFIQNPNESDAWVIYATQNSLGSEPCREEISYALDRALRQRGETFPIIALSALGSDSNLLPAALRTRLYVSLNEVDWKERIKAAAEHRTPAISRTSVLPYLLKVHTVTTSEGTWYSIEVRPRAGSWSPFVAAIPIEERERVDASLTHGAPDRRNRGGAILHIPIPDKVESNDGKWWLLLANNEATPTQSYYIQCQILPTKVAFGVDGQGLYLHEIRP